MSTSPILQNIPCTLVTGFLGAGKTTLINQLLSTRPTDARWALLINEFGRIGIDGALLTGVQDAEDKQGNLTKSNLAISEVSGGCICCTSQLPLQIALTRLLSDHRPQRLIIEPTGLAHPRELIRQLSAAHWQTVLAMQAVITVLSAQQWQQEKYRSHEGFQAHVRAADVLVINRFEQLGVPDRQNLRQWVTTLNAQASIIWSTSNVGDFANNVANSESAVLTIDKLTAQLDQPSQTINQQRTAKASASRIGLNVPRHLRLDKAMMAASTDTRADNELPYRYHDDQQGMLVGGWQLPPHWIFDADSLQQWLSQLPNWQRIKGIVHTSDGWWQLNFTPDSFTINAASAQIDSRLEIVLLADTDTSNNLKIQKVRLSPIDWESCDRELMALIL